MKIDTDKLAELFPDHPTLRELKLIDLVLLAILAETQDLYGLTGSKLGEWVGAPSNTTLHRAHRLEQLGLLERRRDPDKGRGWPGMICRPTTFCMEVLEKVSVKERKHR